MIIDPHLRTYLTFKGQQTDLRNESRLGARPEYYATHETADLVLLGGPDSKTEVRVSWDTPSDQEAIISSELDLHLKDLDGEANLRVRARCDDQGQAFLSITNPSSDGIDSGVELKLPALKEVGEDFLQAGFFSSPEGVSSVRLSFWKNSETGEVLGPSGIRLNDKELSFKPAEKVLELREETRAYLSDVLAGKDLDWLRSV